MVKPFVDKLTWASGIGSNGKPNVLPDSEPTATGNKVCPSVEGATNWMSSAWDAATGLFYVMALEKCSIYTKSPVKWEPGIFSDGGETRDVPGEPGTKVVRALDIQTGKRVWEYPQPGPADSWGGVLSTAGGLVFVCDDSGAFVALDARAGKPLWHFYTSERWHSSPMTYMIEGKQYIAVASGSNILAFGL
jgi:alcohol dehydrogenase (cytochrome c)